MKRSTKTKQRKPARADKQPTDVVGQLKQVRDDQLKRAKGAGYMGWCGRLCGCY